jgi:TolA-binding protein
MLGAIDARRRRRASVRMEPALTRLRLTLALLLATAATPVLADPKPTIDQRVDKVEKEMRAVQRKVFPGGSPAFFEPEIAPTTTQAPPPSAASNSQFNEQNARIDALEKTVAQLTGQIEQDEHRSAIATQQAARERADLDARLKVLEAAATPPPTAQVNDADLSPTVVHPATGTAARPPRSGSPFTTPPSAPLGKPTQPAKTDKSKLDTGKSSAHSDDDQAPAASGSGGDAAGEDAYMAAYRLWDAKKYPEARTALKAFLAKYPKHRRASYAQNLIGRSYLDEGSPGNAAEAFAANYQTNPRGERAQESLYYLGQSLMKLNKPSDACRVYTEIDDAYGDKVPDNLKGRIAAARKEARCK